MDKGFIVDSKAAHEGVIVDRSTKRLCHQIQQSSVDTSQTQKIGNTRIIVENVNGELKSQIRWLNCLIPTLQFSIVSKIVCMGYLLQILRRPSFRTAIPASRHHLEAVLAVPRSVGTAPSTQVWEMSVPISGSGGWKARLLVMQSSLRCRSTPANLPLR